ncbi:hypothetical protein D770_07085 [Flammeovirgaceae bacterium 311]|nr:hypothetical protein D770_07085 [Flammeovirgaceae bacterium 311]
MENFVLLYHFDDKNIEKSFEKEIHNSFPRHRIEENGDFRYFGFADRAEPGVVDKLNTVLSRVDNSMKDYVALYHANKENTDNITRQMLVGHDNVLETKVENLSSDAHRGSLTRLLDFDYVKAMPNPDQKD